MATEWHLGRQKIHLPAKAGRRALNQIVFLFAREGTIELAWRSQNA